MASGRLDGRVAIITGAAGGQGAAEAELFVAEGASVVVTDVDAEAGAGLAERLGDHVRFEPLDVRDEGAVGDGWSPPARRRSVPPSVLVNNAGIMPVGTIEDGDVDDVPRRARGQRDRRAARHPCRRRCRCGAAVAARS